MVTQDAHRPHEQIVASVRALAAAHDWPQLDLGYGRGVVRKQDWQQFLSYAEPDGLLEAERRLQALG